MKILSINMGGTGSDVKRRSLVRILNKERVHFVSIQETKMSATDPFRIKSLWGNFCYDFVDKPAIGRSGGLLSIWDPSSFKKEDSSSFDHFIVVKGIWIASNTKCFMLNVYAPQSESEKATLWTDILAFMVANPGKYLICGDFNSVRCREDRMGTVFSSTNASNFNDFISSGNLVDIPMGRHKYSRVSKDGLKASKIDWIFLNKDFLNVCPNILMTALDDIISDHRPLLLFQKDLDYGPTPFKLYNSWLLHEDFDQLVTNSWSSPIHDSPASHFVSLKDKLKGLKFKIKNWRSDSKNKRGPDDIKADIARIDLQIGNGGTGDLSVDRLHLLHELNELNLKQSCDLKQKARINWAIEGDENSRYFHSVINSRRRNGSIRGIKSNGLWIDEPAAVKNAFREYFANKFERFNGASFSFQADHFNKLSPMQSDLLEDSFSLAEIKKAVWSCGGEKAPGPDGFSFAFIKKYWDIVKVDIHNMMHEFYFVNEIPKGCNSSFITLIPKVDNPLTFSDFRPISLIGIQYKIISKILANRLAMVIDSIVSPEQSAFVKGRQILDGPLLLNEVIDWYRIKKKSLLLFKIDFAKAFDSLSWDYLFDILKIMGFGNKWISWIMACLTSARSSVLINGSPTEEFQLARGLRQGDPLAPFLFIIAMEGLHVAIDNLVSSKSFLCAKIKDINISHLFYADDVILIGEWSESNMRNISSALRFFYGISGLKINFQKSSILGVGVANAEITRLANLFGCKTENFPFKYLGIPIGGKSNRATMWEPVVNKFNKRLSKWKASLLSIGGRATLISSVLGSMAIYYLSIFRMPKMVSKSLESIRSSFFWGGTRENKKMSWLKWTSILASKKDGGLGFGSLEGLNLALLFKWIWRGLTNPNNFWAKVLKAIHGDLCFQNQSSVMGKGLWHNIVGALKNIQSIPQLNNFGITKRVGNGKNTRFWKDLWIGEECLSFRFPRLFALETEKDCIIHDRRIDNLWQWKWRRPVRSGRESQQLDDLANILPTNMSENPDGWSWCLEGNNQDHFSVAMLRTRVDHYTLSVCNYPTRWNNLIPKKINIFRWRLLRDCLPTHLNLSRRGIDINSIRCLRCNSGNETVDHLFRECNIAHNIRSWINRWCQTNIPDLAPKELLSWLDTTTYDGTQKRILDAILSTYWWLLWKARNNLKHNGTREKAGDICSAISSLSFMWISNRNKKIRGNWNNWLLHPLEAD